MTLYLRTLLYTSLCLASSSLFSFTATSYEPIQCQLPVPNLSNGSTTLSVTGNETEGHWAYDTTENKVAFLEQFGTAPIADLFKGLATPSSQPLTYRYFNSSGAESLINTDGSDTPVDAALRFNDNNNKYNFRSLHFGAVQHLFTGLFVQVSAQLVEQTLEQAPSASGTDAAHARVVSFLEKFDDVMAEHDLPSTKSNKRPVTLERFAVLAGWTGQVDLKHSLFKELSGSISGGYVSTPPDFFHPLAPAALPYNISDGFIARGTVHAQISPHIAADLDLSTTVYNQRNGVAHVVHDDTQGDEWYAGPLLIGTGMVKKDPGTLWTLHASVSANRFYGFSLSAGYQFSYQETTQLEIKDSTTLRGTDWTGDALYQLPALQKSRLNSDPRLARWKHHALMFGLSFEPGTSYRIAPRFDARIYMPLLGHHTINTDYVYSGGGQLSIQWKF